jgi:hypothetical protein
VTIEVPAFDLATASGIAGLAWLVAGVWAWLFGRRERILTFRLAAGALFVLALGAAAASSGFLQRMDVIPPPMALMMASVFAAAFALGLSAFGRASATRVPLVALVAFQSFRLPLELVMHRAATLGIMPVELSYSGYNFDIVTGVGALLLALAMFAGLTVPRGLLWAWNVWGCWCLTVITFVAIGGSPLFRIFGDGPHVNSWILFAPYVWLPTVLVVAALFGHIVITRALLSAARAEGRTPTVQ